MDNNKKIAAVVNHHASAQPKVRVAKQRRGGVLAVGCITAQHQHRHATTAAALVYQSLYGISKNIKTAHYSFPPAKKNSPQPNRGVDHANCTRRYFEGLADGPGEAPTPLPPALLVRARVDVRNALGRPLIQKRSTVTSAGTNPIACHWDQGRWGRGLHQPIKTT